MVISSGLILAGLVLLYYGAEWLVKGSSSLALRFGVSQVVVGLTVVAYGTSMPELVVSLNAALIGQGNISAANVIGSNIMNILIIVGLTAVISPMTAIKRLIKIDTPLMLGATALFIFFIKDLYLSRVEGLILLALMAAFGVYAFFSSKDTEEVEEIAPTRSIFFDILYMVAGLAFLGGGAKSLVSGAVSIAQAFNVSEAVIGLTIVALGTSLPELATSVVAALKKNHDIALGNIVGSNFFNILLIAGTSASISPFACAKITTIDMATMFASAAALLFVIVLFKGRIGRITGGVFLAGYGAYGVYLSSVL